MNQIPHKFLITSGIFIVMIVGIVVAIKFDNINLSAMTMSLLLVNSLLLLIIIGILLHSKVKVIEKANKKRG